MKPKDVLDLSCMSPAALIDESARLSAVVAVKAAVTHNTNLEPLLAQLLSIPKLLEFILSASAKCSQILSAYILSQYPTAPEVFSSSLANTLLQQFYAWLPSVQALLPEDISKKLDGYCKSVLFAPDLLDQLSSIIISGELSVPKSSELSFGKNKHKVQRINFDVFKKAECSVPKSQETAKIKALIILDDMKFVLQEYLLIVSDRAYAQIFLDAYLLQARPRGSAPTMALANGLDQVNSATEEAPAEPISAFPVVQPMKAALNFGNTEGFGKWRILLSTRANRNIREWRRSDASTFKIIFRKIRELSNGQFSSRNQNRLNGHDTGVNIFEARMTRDLRLVYQVDCITEDNSDNECQVLRVFGIYTRAQINRGFWDSMAFQLAKKGKEYQRRCNMREESKVKGDYVIDPKQFYAPTPETVEPQTTLLDLPQEHLDEIHSLVLDKFVAFSRPLLNSIIADQDVSHVFALTSREKEIVEHSSSCYVQGRSGTGKTTVMVFKMLGIERAWTMHNGEAKPRQLFVTQSRVLAGKVEEYFLKVLDSFSIASLTPREIAKRAKEKQSRNEDGVLVDLDDDTRWRNDLPERFSQLDDRHFPLFITFDKLCKLLEADMPYPCMTSIVTFEIFRDKYWPRFPHSLTKGLDASLVFSEIMGVIKGSEDALKSQCGYLDRLTYESLSHRSQSTFSHQRTIAYSLFEAYTKRKKMEGHSDSADRTHSLLHNIQLYGTPGRIDFLYVDEAQDNLLIDALLLRLLCRNANGLFWAGDTAQTISEGSSFRFNDLKSFMFRIEQRNTALSRSSSAPVAPRSFQLAINYRSHGGIVSCAHSVVELITRFWPYAIDILPREEGVVDGLKPVFFHGGDSDTVQYEQFLFGSGSDHIEFGAKQVILVRNEIAREKLRQEADPKGIIMTVYESKGLEFNDVLLYNFFEDSTANYSQWRVVLNAADWNAPQFDDNRHAGICSELKCLYVAITRAKKNLWIVDCSEKSGPMRVFLSSQDRVRCCTLGADIPRLAASSTSAEWADTGERLFKHKKYLQAMHCFERGGMRREVDIANAHFLREQAYTSGGTSKKPFLDAAEAFLKCASAAMKDKEKIIFFNNAGGCFIGYGDHGRAAKAFYAGKDYTLAAQHYGTGGLFDEAVRVIQTHREDIESDVANKIYHIARIHYFQDTNTLSQARDLFDTADEAIEFADDNNFHLAQARLLDDERRYAEAADVYLSEGRLIDAVKMFLSHLNDPKCVRSATDKLLQGLWGHLSFGVAPESATTKPSLQQWLKLAAQLVNTDHIIKTERDEISMFWAIIAKNTQTLRRLGLSFYRSDNKPAALLCFDHIFNTPLTFDGSTLDEMASSLDIFYKYAKLLCDMAFTQDPCDCPFMQKLFSIQPLRDDYFTLPVGTLLYDTVTRRGNLPFDGNTARRTVSNVDLSRTLKATLSGRVRMRVMEETDAFMTKATSMSPCLDFLADSCDHAECTRTHVGTLAVDTEWYNARVRIYLKQILVFQVIHCVNVDDKRWFLQRRLLDRLYEVLNPPFNSLGSQAILDLGRFPEADTVFGVVKDWVRHLVYTANSWDQPTTFMTTFLRAGVLGFSLDSRNASEYMYRAPCITSMPPSLFVQYQERNFVRDLVVALHNTKSRGIQAGFGFVRHVLFKQVPINVGVLCDFVERLCGRLIVFRRYQKTSTFNGVTLPKSWIVDIAKDFTRDSGDKKDTRPQLPSVSVLVRMLRRIYSGIRADHLLFESYPVSGQAKHLFVARMCRAISLLGYNIEYYKLRYMILRDITSLHEHGRDIHRLYRRYFNASTWQDIVNAMTQSAIDMKDELISLRDERAGGAPLAHHAGIRQTNVQNSEDLDQVFGADVLTKSILLCGTNATVGRNLGDPSQALHTDIPETFVFSGSQDDAETLAQPVDVAEHEEEIATFTQSQRAAAKVFQHAYQRLIQRRGQGEENPLAIKRSRLFLKCLSAAEEIHWKQRRYRFLFLGPLPHLLLCLEKANNHAYSTKNRLKERFKTAYHRDLDEAQAKMTEINLALKECNRLQKALQPSAPLHVHQNSRQFKVLVKDAEAFLRSHPCINEFEEDLRLAVKGIVTQPSQKKKLKPESNLGDLDDYTVG